MKAKKFLTVLSLSALLAGTGVTTLQSYQQASAATKKHKSTKKVKKAKKAKSKKEKLNSDGTDKQSKYSSFGEWFVKNRSIIENYYYNNGGEVWQAQGPNDEGGSQLSVRYYNNPAYKYAYIDALGNDIQNPSYTGGAGTAEYFNKMYNVYKAAAPLVKQSNPNGTLYLNKDSMTWSATNPND